MPGVGRHGRAEADRDQSVALLSVWPRALGPGCRECFGKAAGLKAKPQGDNTPGEHLQQAEVIGLLLLLRCEPAPGLGGAGHLWTV